MKQSIQYTEDLDQFGIVSSNREVDQAHVRRLAKAIKAKNMLHLNPIVVNEAMQVIDGQHRLAAADSLGCGIWYIQDTEVTKRDIGGLNSVKKNWNIMDYINYWTVEKAPGYAELSQFLSENSFLPVSVALRMLSSDDSGYAEAIRSGRPNILNIGQARKDVELLRWYAENTSLPFTKHLVVALLRIIRHKDYSHEKMIDKISRQPRSVVRCVNSEQYLDMFAEIYNYQQQYKVRFES